MFTLLANTSSKCPLISQESAAARDMLERYRERYGYLPQTLAADNTYGNGEFLHWLDERGIAPHIRVKECSTPTKDLYEIDSSHTYPKRTAMSVPKASDWPAEEVTDPYGTIRYVLKDGTELHRIELQPVHDDDTGLPIFENGKQLKAGPTGKLGFFEPSRGDTDTWRKAVSAFRSWNDPESKPIDGSMGQSQPRYNDLPEEIIVEIEDY
jgi:hypothetical protein